MRLKKNKNGKKKSQNHVSFILQVNLILTNTANWLPFAPNICKLSIWCDFVWVLCDV